MKSLTKTVARIVLVVSLVILMPSFPRLSRVQAAAGDLDLTFGSVGKVTTDFFGFFDNGFASALQTDGKIIVAGTASTNTINSVFALVRYHANGTLDNSFGTGGRVTTLFPVQQSGISAIAIQPDGKIIAAGSTNSGLVFEFDFALARYNTDGTLDTTFGSNGIITTDFFGLDDNIFAVAIQPDGKIVAGGEVDTEDNFGQTISDFGLARYNTDGSLDTTFGSGGKVAGDFSGSVINFRIARAIALQPDGKILMIGGIDINNQLSASISRFNADGSTDNTFGLNGRVVNDSIFGVGACGVQPDGHLLIGGPDVDGIQSILRYSPDGVQDLAFGTGGLARSNFGSPASFNAITVQSNGKIVGVGQVSVVQNTSLDFGISRFNADGSLDQSFGTGGKLTVDFLGDFDVAFGVNIQKDGNIVASGFARAGSSGNDFAVVRLKGDPITPAFDLCVQDESNNNIFQINTATDKYEFINCEGLVVGGTGRLTKKGCTLTLQHNSSSYRVQASINICQNKATVSVRLLSQGTTFTITDRNVTNNTCTCVQ